MFLTNILKEDSVYFASDISDEMNRLYTEHFDKLDIAHNPKVKLNWIKDASDQIDVSQYVDEMGPEISKKLF